MELRTRLNGICPYFTMFPLDFPLRILNRAKPNHSVLDPFCGRGTTNFAARLLKLNSLGVDSSPVATAITEAKLIQANASDIVREARAILSDTTPNRIPSGEFWTWAYHPEVLFELCQIRTALLTDCSVPERVALRAIVLGALHGPQQKTVQSYFSNQSPRTYSPKPAYATRYWRLRNLPPRVDILEIIERKAMRYYDVLEKENSLGEVRQRDSREVKSLLPGPTQERFSWVVTSPPYYGMNTYIPDQWLRHWFVGGKDYVEYTSSHQISHSSPDHFVKNLRKVWSNVAKACASNATLVVRFGGVGSRKADPLELAKSSFKNSGWHLQTIKPAGDARSGRRQADTFLRSQANPILEHDLWARLA